MPSWIALITTALVSFHTRILILPLLLLAGLFPPLHSILQRTVPLFLLPLDFGTDLELRISTGGTVWMGRLGDKMDRSNLTSTIISSIICIR